MKLQNGDRAIIPIGKLLGYCLNPNHPKGKHKARVFKSALGITADNAEPLTTISFNSEPSGLSPTIPPSLNLFLPSSNNYAAKTP
jgi:hypothetical protein